MDNVENKILDMLDEAAIEAKVFVGHPMAGCSLEEKILYLQVLALVLYASHEVKREEKNYIALLVRSWSIDDSILDDVLSFAQQPELKAIVYFFKCFEAHPNKYNFLFDAFMMMAKNPDMTDTAGKTKQQVIRKIAQNLQVSQDMMDSLASLVGLIDFDKTDAFYSALINVELDSMLFLYLREFYELKKNPLRRRSTGIDTNAIAASAASAASVASRLNSTYFGTTYYSIGSMENISIQNYPKLSRNILTSHNPRLITFNTY